MIVFQPELMLDGPLEDAWCATAPFAMIDGCAPVAGCVGWSLRGCVGRIEVERAAVVAGDYAQGAMVMITSTAERLEGEEVFSSVWLRL